MPYQLEANTIVQGTFYRHYKGGVYEIVTLAMMERDGTTQVVYKNWDGHVFVRPISEFMDRVALRVPPDDAALRFAPISDIEALRDLQTHEQNRNIKRST